MSAVKCKKCRKVLLENCQDALINAHTSKIRKTDDNVCESVKNQSVWYINDGSLPEWCSLAVEKSEWTKGKLNCPECSARVGNFDFISGLKCTCGQCMLPSVYFIKSKVDDTVTV